MTKKDDRIQNPFDAIVNAEVVKLLLQHHADVNAINFRNQTPLHTCIEVGCAQTTYLLLHAGADVNAVDNMGKTPLMLAKKYVTGGRIEQQETARPILCIAGGGHGASKEECKQDKGT